MHYRQFGKTSITVSEIGFGCMRLAGTSLERKSKREVLHTLAEALDAGITFYDTADMYGQGRSETILGQALSGHRSKVIVATKAGYRLSRAGSFVASLKPYLRPLVRRLPSLKRSVQQIRASEVSQDFTPAYLGNAIDQSLARLRTGYIDLFQLHNPPTSTIASGDFLPAIECARVAGKIRWYGISCRTLGDAILCCQLPGIAAIQLEMNLLNMHAAASVVREISRKEIAVIVREPFASGALLKAENTAHENSVKLRKHETAVKAALEAVLSTPGVSVVIPGMSSRAHLRENIQAIGAALFTEANQCAEARANF